MRSIGFIRAKFSFFNIMMLIFIVLLLLAILQALYILTKLYMGKNRRITTRATVIAKKISIFGTADSSYLITFELESKDRLVFEVVESDYGCWMEGDYGELTYKEKKRGKNVTKIFDSFERMISKE